MTCKDVIMKNRRKLLGIGLLAIYSTPMITHLARAQSARPSNCGHKIIRPECGKLLHKP